MAFRVADSKANNLMMNAGEQAEEEVEVSGSSLLIALIFSVKQDARSQLQFRRDKETCGFGRKRRSRHMPRSGEWTGQVQYDQAALKVLLICGHTFTWKIVNMVL